MKNYRYVLMATVVLSSCAAQPGRPVMGEAQYKGFALSSVTGEQCALTGMLDVDLAAANSVMLEAQAAAFEYDPARMEIERRQAAIDLQRGDGVTEPVCNALAYEVMRTLAVQDRGSVSAAAQADDLAGNEAGTRCHSLTCL